MYHFTVCASIWEKCLGSKNVTSRTSVLFTKWKKNYSYCTNIFLLNINYHFDWHMGMHIQETLRMDGPNLSVLPMTKQDGPSWRIYAPFREHYSILIVHVFFFSKCKIKLWAQIFINMTLFNIIIYWHSFQVFDFPLESVVLWTTLEYFVIFIEYQLYH